MYVVYTSEVFDSAREVSLDFTMSAVGGGGELAKGSEKSKSSERAGAFPLEILRGELKRPAEGEILRLLDPFPLLSTNIGSARSPVDWKSSDRISTPGTAECFKALPG